MGIEQVTIDKIFCEAIEIVTSEEREAYIQRACDGNEDLRAQVRNLLDAHFAAGSFLDAPAPELQATVQRESMIEHVGQMIGPYKLREKLGEGGMGVVWAAEQTQPLRRKVAVKVIRPGMDSESVVARFEAEREALALMDHPNIARVLDAGATDEGRPYFVMELIRGVPITDFCDKNKLTVRERLQLFMDVCKGIQHAHQKGIIHRDIKPSNVLVTLHDDRPVPKVIDFGVAKALHQPLTDRSIYTGVFQAIGTLAYMSPEQAQLSGLDIDTRADIYGLGVLLYELLIGTTPFDKDELASAAFDEACRVIREKQPAKPSTKVSTLGDSATGVSACRSTDPRGLSKFITGDLDVIAMTAIEKDRTRRYGTASGLADDVQRFLDDQPIVARAPSMAYRFGKFARRNRVPLATSALVLVSLVIGMAGLAWGLQKANRYVKELTSLAETYRSELFERALIEAMRASPKAEQLIARAETAGVEQWRIEMLRGQFALYSGHPEEAVDHFQDAVRIANENGTQCVAAESMLAIAYFHAGRLRDLLVQSSKVDSLPLSEPVQPYDCLFKAQGYIAFPQRGLEILDQGYPMDQAQTALSLAVRAELLAWSAVTYDDLGQSRRAIECAHAARLLLGDTPFALQADLLAHASMIAVARKQGEDWQLYDTQACSIASVLFTNYPDYAWGSEVRSYHCLAAGDLAGAEQALLDASKASNSPFYKTSLAMVCYQSDSADMVATAHDIFRNMDSLWDKGIIAKCLTDTPEGRDMARAIREQILADAENDPQLLAGLARVSLILGEPETAQGHAEKALREAGIEGGAKSAYLPWTRTIDEFLAGRIAANELLVQAGSRGNLKSEAHLVIATKYLANREDKVAREHLNLAVECGFPFLWSYQFADGLRKRLNDPGRLEWLMQVDSKD